MAISLLRMLALIFVLFGARVPKTNQQAFKNLLKFATPMLSRKTCESKKLMFKAESTYHS